MNPRYFKMIRLVVLAALLAAALLLCAPAMAQTRLSLNARAKTLYVGSNGAQSSYQLKTRTTAKAAATVKWSSSNDAVARVSADGLITPVKKGVAVIRCIITQGKGKRLATCRVTVRNVRPKSVSIVKPRTVFDRGDEVGLSATVYPANATNKSVVFRSSKPSVASITKDGKLTCKKEGTATIVCTTVDGKKRAGFKIRVNKSFKGINYRLYAIGNAAYQGDNKLPGCKNDLSMVVSAFKNARFSGQKAQITAKLNLKGSEMRRMLASMANCGATSSDVTVFYFTGHGISGGGMSGALAGVDWDAVQVNEVQKYLDKVPGKVVVMLDCCLSGQYITSKSAGAAAQSFNSAFISGFKSGLKSKALTDSKYKSKYKILTASGPRQPSYISNDRNDACSVFTDYLALGLGEDCRNGRLESMQADGNGDAVVTLNELYKYVSKRVKAYVKRYPAYRQTTMVWPSGDGTPVIARWQ